MYCPSCDKTYGAIHSRCPECHSWLKVSAPSKGRAAVSKVSKAAQAPVDASPKASSVSTLDRVQDEISWADPIGADASSPWAEAPVAESAWDATDTPAAGSSHLTGLSDPGSSWGDSGSSSGWGSPSASPVAPTPVSAPSPKPAASLAASTPVSKPAVASGWLSGDEADDGWGGGSANAAPKPAAPEEKKDGWLSAGGGSPADSQHGGGWQGGAGGGSTQYEPSAGRGWLGDPVAEAPAKSMTEMVDHAISAEHSDDFVDDSWVDEEIRDNFDEFEAQEFLPPTPEVGGVFLKMALVAILVVFVGGGMLALRNPSKTPEQTEAERVEQRLEFGRATFAEGKEDLKSGKADLAIPQFKEAMVALSEGKAPQNEVYDTEVYLSKALMSAEEYEDAYKHWLSLKNSGQEKYVAQGKKGLGEAGRKLRIKANNILKEAKADAAKGDISSVKRMGKDALEIYEKFDGNNGQLGHAYGIIGRGHYNGREYPVAQQYFKKAVALAPNLGYETLLSEVNQRLQPSYNAPIYRSNEPRQTAAPRPRPVRASVVVEQPSYRRPPRAAPVRRAPSRPAASAPSAPAAPAPRVMKEIPIHRPAQQSSGSGRAGQKGVLTTY